MVANKVIVFEANYENFTINTVIVNSDNTKTAHTKFWINKLFERKIKNIFLPISFNLCFGSSNESSH